MCVTQGRSLSQSLSQTDFNLNSNLARSIQHVPVTVPRPADYERNGIVYEGGDLDGESYYQLI
jgi:hypothetical protein